jgi:hypothetical protein
MPEDNFQKFSTGVVKEFKKIGDRAVAFLYFREKKRNVIGSTIGEIAGDFELAGLSRPRPAVLKEIFRKDPRVIKYEKDKRRLSGDKIEQVGWQFDSYLQKKKTPPQRILNSSPFDFGPTFDIDNISGNGAFVSNERIKELEEVKKETFDLTRLIKMCREINDNFSRKNYISVIVLVRSALDHIPPIFGHKSFSEIVNNAKLAKSIKASFEHLDTSSRNIADAYLHIQIRDKEILPTEKQVNFSHDIDTLLGEIVRTLK